MSERETQHAYWMERCTHFENRTAQLLRERDDRAAEVARLRAVIAEWHERERHPLALMGDPCQCPDCTQHRKDTTT